MRAQPAGSDTVLNVRKKDTVLDEPLTYTTTTNHTESVPP